MTAKRFTFEIKIQGNKAYTQWYDNGKLINSAETLCELLNELHKENQKLAKVIEEDEKLIQSAYDELTKLRCIKKNLGRIKSQWDWIMEVVQYD